MTEGEIDMIQAYQAGTKNVVAIKGSAFTEAQVNLLKRYTENVLLALDADMAGDAASHRGIQSADAAGLNIKVVEIPDGKDPDDCIKKDPEVWKKAVADAVPFYDYIIDSAVKKYDSKSAEGKKKIISETAKFLQPIGNAVVKAHYLQKLSGLLSVSEEIIETQIQRESKQESRIQNLESREIKDEIKLKRRDYVEEYLLALLLQSGNPDDWLVFIRNKLTAADFNMPARGKIYENLTSLDKLPEELKPMVDKLFLMDLGGVLEDQEEMHEEVTRTVWEIKELILREKLNTISMKIKQKGEDEDLQKEFMATSDELQKLIKDRKMINE